jgi:hypothetical protein
MRGGRGMKGSCGRGEAATVGEEGGATMVGEGAGGLRGLGRKRRGGREGWCVRMKEGRV